MKILITTREKPQLLEETIASEKIVLENHNEDDIESVVSTRLMTLYDKIMKQIEEKQKKLYDFQKFKAELTSRAEGVFL